MPTSRLWTTLLAASQKLRRRPANRLRHATILIASGTFLLGLISQPVLGQIFNNLLSVPDKLLMATCIVTAYILIISVNAFILRERENADMTANILNSLKDLKVKSGLLVEFLRRGEPNSSNPYEIMTQLISEATEEVLVLDHRVLDPDRFGQNTRFDDPARKAYYDLLTKMATHRLSNGRYLRYRRIVQLKEGYASIWDAKWNGDSTFADHCSALVEMRTKQVQFPSAIKTSQVFFPNSSIVIVDRKKILLELAISDPNGKAKIQGDLVFHDPQAILAGPLCELFEYIDTQSMLVTEVKS